MSKRIFLILAAVVFVGCSGTGREIRSADIVYTNGKIYTVNEAQPWAEAVIPICATALEVRVHVESRWTMSMRPTC